MNCPECGLDGSEIIRTERAAHQDRRRHRCKCGVRWTSVARIEKGSVTLGVDVAKGLVPGISRRVRFCVFKRDNFRCRYCGRSGVELTLDHVVPVSAPIPEGEDKASVLAKRNQADNLVTACSECNVGKSDDIGVEPPDISRLPNSAENVANNAANGASTGELYSENGKRPDSNLVNPKASESPERERARSKQDTEFTRLLKIFCDRWQRSNKRPYPVTAADRNQLGRFMKEQGHYIATFGEICDRYLSDRHQFTITRSGNHRLAWLVTGGLATYGGTPRETAEQYSARTQREHEARKSAARRPVKDPAVRDLIASLADSKAVANG